ncbi:MAG: hypothetical protein QM626_09005 [Microbacterium sp.]
MLWRIEEQMIPEGPLTPAQRELLLQEIAASARLPAGTRPDSLFVGSLAGSETEDRPAVPVWQFPAYAESVGIPLETLATVRFPIISFGGGGTIVTSLSELVSEVPGRGLPTYRVSILDGVRLYSLMHEFGALEWDANNLAHIELIPANRYRQQVFMNWRATLQRTSQ